MDENHIKTGSTEQLPRQRQETLIRLGVAAILTQEKISLPAFYED